ncbi:MAG TPA: TRAP transporter large permease subunit [Kiloniellales bacterium]|nr:TRAP transporter large permease subunit [Kiloniellales bacterium]
MDSQTLALLMFPALFLLMFLGFPVAFALMSVAFAFGLMGFKFQALLFQFTQKVDSVASNFVLAAVPLFVFMGSMLERSGIAEKLFEAVHLWTRRLPGGLAIGTVIMCIIFAASTGVIGATEAVVGLLAIPPMLRYGYNKPMICGTICAGGSLGTIIPPSVVVVVLGPVADVSIGDLLVGMVIPGLLLAFSYIVYLFVLCRLKPHYGPRIPRTLDDPTLRQKLIISAKALVPPLFMIFAVLGSMFFGWAAPTEAAAIGAAASVVLVLCYRRFAWRSFGQALMKTLTVTCMIMLILLAGSLFTGTFVALGGMGTIRALIEGVDIGAWGILALALGVIFAAGFFLEWISIVLIFVPIFLPLVKAFGFDPLWFCMLVLLMIQTSYLTPPMAPAIFYLRGISPPQITIHHMYRGVVPFIVIQLFVAALIIIFPAMALWLPSQVLGFK